MREILFKAKSVDNGEWIEGFYYFTENPKLQNHHIIDKQGNCYGVIPETVCEYTGLMDKNGKRIFENDIVLCNRYDDENYQVVMSDIWNLPREMFGSNLNWREVIGNIFENPELLKGE